MREINDSSLRVYYIKDRSFFSECGSLFAEIFFNRKLIGHLRGVKLGIHLYRILWHILSDFCEQIFFFKFK